VSSKFVDEVHKARIYLFFLRKRKRDYEGYSHAKKEDKVELILQPLDSDLKGLKNSSVGGMYADRNSLRGVLVLPQITKGNNSKQFGQATLSGGLASGSNSPQTRAASKVDTFSNLNSPSQIDYLNQNILPIQPKGFFSQRGQSVILDPQ
jgi:hypothetical protein